MGMFRAHLLPARPRLALWLQSLSVFAASGCSVALNTPAPVVIYVPPPPVAAFAEGLSGAVRQYRLDVSGTCANLDAVDLKGDVSPSQTLSCTNGAFAATVTFSGDDGSKTLSLWSGETQLAQLSVVKKFCSESAIDDANLVGSGTVNDPYLICTASQLSPLFGSSYAPLLAKSFELRDDIDLSGITVLPIGMNSTAGFTGTFNGKGHVIRNLVINRPAMSDVGLFSKIGVGSVVKNLKILDADVHGNDRVGILAGSALASISDVTVKGTVSGGDRVGGLIGSFQNNSAFTQSCTRCYSAGSVTGDLYVGGLINSADTPGGPTEIKSSGSWAIVSGLGNSGGLAGQWYDSITQSFALGNVSGDGWMGGLVGDYQFATGAILSQSFARGAVSGTNSVLAAGGLVGSTIAAGSAVIENSYSRGTVSAPAGIGRLGGAIGDGHGSTGLIMNTTYSSGRVVGGINPNSGGLMGVSDFSSASFTFWDVERSQRAQSAGTDVGAVGVSSALMGNISTYTSWNFGTNPATSIWFMGSEGLPRLWWELTIPPEP